jgi:hypothetical protein
MRSVLLLIVALACGAPRPRATGPDSGVRPPGSGWAACGFPQHSAYEVGLVRLRVYVKADGSAGAVEILEATALEFAQQAHDCALSKRYRPGTDAAGKPVAGYTPPFTVKFVR